MRLDEFGYRDLRSDGVDITPENLQELRCVFRDTKPWGRSFEDIYGSIPKTRLSMSSHEFELFGNKIIACDTVSKWTTAIVENDEGKILLWRRFYRGDFVREEKTIRSIVRGPIIPDISEKEKFELKKIGSGYLFEQLGVDMYSVWLDPQKAVRVYFWKTGCYKNIVGLGLVEEEHREGLYHYNNIRYAYDAVSLNDGTNPVLDKLGGLFGFDIERFSIAFYNPEKLEREVEPYESLLGETLITLK
jgi:hypothetical protein